jgi:ribosomal protein S18 acetylase RimI-like enzyme
MNASTSFRCCQSTDLPVCAGIAVEAFPLDTSRFRGEEAGKFMQVQTDCCHAISNYCELATIDGEVAGLLFGRVKGKSVLIDMCHTLKQLLLISVRFLVGRYGSRRKLTRLFKPGLQSWRALRKNMPASKAEVVFFAVDPKYQGKGIGRALMDRFVRHALRYKIRAISVPTDETASFRFYEKYGFRRWAEYKDPLGSYLADRPVKGFVYQLLVCEAEGQDSEF